ncbi:predicted protein [Uncinocarpus reesii 1704]|uniref:Uncharacterized protein n=1 Tax=Uncinocarpus reesii (strain UAMH 1704) TaxID=336963 RepID=C4JYC1_UNCRE|nr:uncharacterized protein UREG_07172 [Uncinocarpus reesii 1704]EEP82307.1 predicted protein [Uncinocarpus reesii 1704]
MLSIPNTYTGPHTSAGIVIGAVLAAAGGFILLFLILFFTVNRRAISASESVVVSESTRSRRSRAQSRPRRTPEVVDVRSSVTDSMMEEDYVEVFEEEDSIDEPPRRNRRSSGYRTVNPREYGGGHRPMREVRH